MLIRPAQPHDAAAIADVHIRSWQQAYRGVIADAYLASLDATLERRTGFWRESITSGGQVWVASINEHIVGWIAFGPSRDPDASPGLSAEIEAVYVLAEHWGSGVGRALWLTARQQLIDQGFESLTLWVLVQNLRAIRFYRNAGLTPDEASLRHIHRGGQALEEIRYRTVF
jgi:ribosomal protein S18 acetylase RimI-like enzyme